MGRARCCCCCCRCSPASVCTHPPSFTSASSCLPTPVYPLPFTRFRSPILVHHSPPLVHRSRSRSPALPCLFTPPSPFSSAPHACTPAIRGCTGSFVHVRLCRSGACFGRIVRPGSDGGPTRGLGGQGFDQSPETEHLMLGFVRAV